MAVALPSKFNQSLTKGTPLQPSFILRGHSHQLAELLISSDNSTLYSADTNGDLFIWSLLSYQLILSFRPHDGGILTISEYDNGILTHGRDNEIHFYERKSENATRLEPKWILQVNSLTYCQFSLLMTGKGEGDALIAFPSLTKDEFVDIHHLPSLERSHRSVGYNLFPISSTKTGTVMSTKLFYHPRNPSQLHLLVGYESGVVALFIYAPPLASGSTSTRRETEESENWNLVWEAKGHREALMSLALTPSREEAWSVGADHHLCKYTLFPNDPSNEEEVMQKIATPYPGNSKVIIRNDGKLLCVTGWDGIARLYSTKNGKPLAELNWSKGSLFSCCFASTDPTPSRLITPKEERRKVGRNENDEGESEEEEDDDDEDEIERTNFRRSLLATGGKDGRICLWEVYPPI